MLQAGHSSLPQQRLESNAELVAATTTAGGPFFSAQQRLESDADIVDNTNSACETLHRFASLGLKSRIDARSSRSSARIPRHPPAHPPSSSPSTRSSRAEVRVLPWMFCMWWARAGLTVAAKAGADAPGGGISLCFCRRGCAAPAQKAATLNDPPPRNQPKPPRSTSRHAQRAVPQAKNRTTMIKRQKVISL